jgi:hypothetical protein
MVGIKILFEILSADGFSELARLTTDDTLILAPGATPLDLPGIHGDLVRRRLDQGEIQIVS